MLIGVRFMSASGRGVVQDDEFHLDQGTPPSVVGGFSNGESARSLENGISLGDFEAREAVDIGKKHGIYMPSGPESYKPTDGVQFLVALLAMFWRNNGYSWVEPITN